jgi:hypothetical protein
MPKRRRIAVENVLKCGVTSDEKEARRIAKKSFCHLAGHIGEALFVPGVVTKENWREHLVHCHVRLRPATGEHRALPHSGQAQPSGHLTSMILLSQLRSSGYLASISCRLPITPFSARTWHRLMLPIVASRHP